MNLLRVLVDVLASIIVDQGLQNSLDATFDVGGAGAGTNFDPVDAMAVSDFGALASGTTSIGAATNSDINAFDADPTRSGQTVTCIATWGTGEANFAITTITLHNDGAGTATGVYGGVDNQSLTKTNDFSLTITLDVTYQTA